VNTAAELRESLARFAREVQSRFSGFYLGGGTAIMLKYQHRISTDLDFFSEKEFSFQRLINKLRKFYSIERFNILADNMDVFISGIKVSFIFFPFQNLEKLQKVHGILMASDYDLFLNKVYAGGRRIVWKDPFDAAFLWNTHRWSAERVRVDFGRKFPGQSYEIFLGALLDFEAYPSLSDSTKEILLAMKASTVS